MITLEKAIEIARNSCGNSLIRTVFEYKDEYRFMTSPGNYFAVDDVAVGIFVVNKKTGETHGESTMSMDFKFLKMDPIERKKASSEYDKAMNNMQPVDLTKEQWNEYLEYMRQFQ